jgi:cytidylate kinase
MRYRAVALSQVDGALGEAIAHGLAERLGFGYLNEAVIGQVASDQGLDAATVADAERRRSLVERLAQATAFAGVDVVASDASLYAVDRTDLILGLIRDAVRDAAARGDVVLVGHAASYACADRTDVLRVCITAPFEARVLRTADSRGISEKDATKLLRQSDAGRLSYLRRVYGVDGESPTDYDIVVNTDRLEPRAAVDAVFALARTADRAR